MPLHRLLPLAVERRQAFLDLLQRFVEVESPTRDEAACDRMADLLFATLAADGWRVERDPRSGVGDVLAAALPDTGGGPGTLVLAHYDTVWPLGTLSEMPWRVDDAADRAYGPGTVDMKAGIAGTLLAARLLRELGVTPPGPVTLLITSDEEVGSAASRERIEAEARRHARVLVVEGARDDGALKVGRKGVADYHLEFTGVPAHAGNYPDQGASALVELAHMALFVRTLDDRDAGTTAHPTVARAGGAVNVITEHARLDVDARVLRMDEAERIDAAMRHWQPRDPRVTVAVHGGLNRPPMEPTPANLAAFEEARRIAAGWGLELESAVVGGGSDGNFTSALGVPTLDGLGACGGGAHARDEHVRIGDTLARVALLAALLGGLAPA
ncbi:MAG: M20 family metallopeptidase [Trueperaceae bacterium]